jgi:hypothetical protein
MPRQRETGRRYWHNAASEDQPVIAGNNPLTGHLQVISICMAFVFDYTAVDMKYHRRLNFNALCWIPPSPLS